MEIKALLRGTTFAFAIVLITIFFSKRTEFSRTIVISAWFLSLFLFPISRIIVKRILIKLNLWKKKLLILGLNESSLLILKSIKRNKTMGYEIIGFLDDDPKKIGKKISGVKVIGQLSDLEKIANASKSKDIMLTTAYLTKTEFKKLFFKCEHLSESMWLIPQSGDLITEGVELEVLDDVLTLYIKKNLAKPWNIFIKNVFDKLLAIIMLIIFLPVMIVIAIAIKFESKGPAFFIQKRIGKDKKMFNMIKYRSMYLNNDTKLSAYLNDNPNAKQEWDRYKKLKNHDPRVTKIGRLIRKFSLDELPQLFNVIQGNMNLVGPRPYISEELIGKDTSTDTIARVKPGITGLWQVSGRSELPFEERIKLDEYYIRNWSLWLDMVIIVKSFRVMLSSKGAY